MSFNNNFIVNEVDRNGILSNEYLIRYQACNTILKQNNIPREIVQLRRAFKLIDSDIKDISVLNQVLDLLQNYINSFNKDIEFDKLDQTEINELFLDSCFDYENLTKEKAIAFFEHGADINYKPNDFLKPFFYVARSSDINLLKEFLTRGADVNEILQNNSETIWNLNHSCNFEKIKLFVEFGANVNSQKNDGKTVLHDLCESNKKDCLECFKYLIEKGADINIKESSGKSLLHLATLSSNEDMVNFLIQKGLHVDLVDDDGNTPLMIATQYYFTNIVRVLIDNGADKSIKNLSGESAYETSLKNQFFDIAQIIDSENASKDAEIIVLRKQIIFRFKTGRTIGYQDKEGGERFEFNEGVYKQTYIDQSGDTKTVLFETDDEAFKHLLGSKADLEDYKTLLKRFS